MKRIKGWEHKLAECIKDAYDKTFEWGTFDCCMFSADTVFALTGVDLAADYRGSYSTEDGAYAIAGANLGDFVAARAEANSMPALANPRMGQRGDLMVVTNQGREAVGIVGLDGRFALCAAPTGLASVPMKDWLKGWKV
jgi:hypothetical protein